MCWATMVTSPRGGTVTGSFPMRDMPKPPSLPDVGEDFAAHAVALGLPVGLEPGRRRDDRDAEATKNVRQFGRFCVDPQTRVGHAPETGDAALTVGAVLQLDDEVLVLLAGLVAVARDVAFALQDLGNVRLELGVGKHDLVVVRRVRVTQTCQEVCDGVGHRHGDLSTFLAWFPAPKVGRGLWRSGSCYELYQLDLRTPGSSPACATSRRQIRHSPNLRKTACGRPQRWQRV